MTRDHIKDDNTPPCGQTLVACMMHDDLTKSNLITLAKASSVTYNGTVPIKYPFTSTV